MTAEPLNIVVGFRFSAEQEQRLRDAVPSATVRFVDWGKEVDALADADIAIVWSLRSEDIAKAPRLKWVQAIAAGVDRMDGASLRARGIPLTNSSGIHATNISEHILALMFAFARRLPHFHTMQQQHQYDFANGRYGLFEVTEQTLLIVGLGKIGEALAVRGKGLGMRVLATRRRLGIERDSAADDVFPLSELRDRIGEADHIAITLPLTPETEGMFDRDLLEAMKPGAHIYNIGRGPIIDQDVLIELLQSGQIGGAGLDVTTPEPLPADSPLWDLPNVILTPHTSGYSPKLWDRGMDLWIDNLHRFVEGRELRNVVDIDAGY